MKSTKELYREFLQSPFWKDISSQCKARDGRCKKCGSRQRLQAHHVFYPSDWFDTTLEHLITLCHFCHKEAHGINRKHHRKRRNKIPKVVIVDWESLNLARCAGQINRSIFLKLKKKFPQPFPAKKPNPPRKKVHAWWPGMYEGTPMPKGKIKGSRAGSFVTGSDGRLIYKPRI